MVKKVVVTKGKSKDYTNEIRQSYELGFTPYRLHTNPVGTYVTPPFVFMMERYMYWTMLPQLKLVIVRLQRIQYVVNCYILEGDDGSGVALQGDRRPSGVEGLKGDSGGQGSVGSQCPAGKRGAVGPGGPPGQIGKMGPVGSKGDAGALGEKCDKEDAGSIGHQGPVVPRGSAGTRGVQDAKGLRGVAGIQGPLGVQGHVGANGVKGERGPLEIKVIAVNEVNVVNEEKRACKVILQMF